MTLTANNAPCKVCVGNLSKTAEDAKARIIYQWREGGKTLSRVWDFRP